MKNKAQYSSKDEAINADFYGYFLRANEDDGWGAQDKYGNFDLLLKLCDFTQFPLNEASVLDVGSGTGDFSSYLHDRSVKKYTGIELFPLSAQLAQLKFPEETFIIDDFLKYEFKEKFDFVFCSGALAAILDTDNYQMMESFLEKMWDLCTKGIAINFLTKRDEHDTDDMLFLYDLEKVLTIVREKTSNGKFEYILNRAGDQKEFLQAHLYLIK